MLAVIQFELDALALGPFPGDVAARGAGDQAARDVLVHLVRKDGQGGLGFLVLRGNLKREQPQHEAGEEIRSPVV